MKSLSCLRLKPTAHKCFFLSSVILAFCVSPAYGFQLILNDLDPVPTPPLSNGDPTTHQGATMKFNNVASDNGTTLDLIITVVDSYDANNFTKNQVVNTDEAQINIKKNTSTTFEFKFLEAGTSTPFTVSEVDFGLMDIDRQGAEIVTLYTNGDYQVSSGANPTELDIATFIDRIEFKAKSTSTGEVTNPSDATNLLPIQEQHAVNFTFRDISQFYLGYEYTSGGGGGRNFFFAGDVTLDPINSVTNSVEVPFEFSPSLGLIISGITISTSQWLRNKHLKKKSF